VPASAATVAAWAGACRPTLADGHLIRQAAGYPHAGRTDPRRIADALSRLGVPMLHVQRRDLAGALADGYAFMLPIELERLPAWRRRSRAQAGGHCGVIADAGAGELVAWLDPLRPAGSSADYAPLEELLAAAWSRPLPGARAASAKPWRMESLAAGGSPT
jgi:hypothetical protein